MDSGAYNTRRSRKLSPPQCLHKSIRRHTRHAFKSAATIVFRCPPVLSHGSNLILSLVCKRNKADRNGSAPGSSSMHILAVWTEQRRGVTDNSFCQRVAVKARDPFCTSAFGRKRSSQWKSKKKTSLDYRRTDQLDAGKIGYKREFSYQPSAATASSDILHSAFVLTEQCTVIYSMEPVSSQEENHLLKPAFGALCAQMWA